VLWVDDNPANNQALIDHYRPLGISFDLALSTKQALDFLAQGEYALIISDIGRGDDWEAGIHMIPEIRSRFPKAPPIIIYAHPKAVEVHGWSPLSLFRSPITPGKGCWFCYHQEFQIRYPRAGSQLHLSSAGHAYRFSITLRASGDCGHSCGLGAYWTAPEVIRPSGDFASSSFSFASWSSVDFIIQASMPGCALVPSSISCALAASPSPT
jgi:hypothetical protein